MNAILPFIKIEKEPSLVVQERVKDLILQLRANKMLSKTDYLYVLNNISNQTMQYLFDQANDAKQPFYGNKVFLRALIEISNYCQKGCFYCGISRYNTKVNRYRLSYDDIIDSCDRAYQLGYRTFVLQAGEDPHLTEVWLTKLIKKLKHKFDGVRITLSLGEHDKSTYQKWYDAGANRYLLRHETASQQLYESIHSNDMSLEKRKQCLYDLKAIGYQVGAGFMVGIPNQTNDDLVEDLVFLKQLNPHMIGIGPYLCHENTKLAGNDSGTLNETLVLLAMVRLILPKVLLPSTTALGTIANNGRELGLLAGANVFMPNVSPTKHRKDYEIYQNKICLTDTTETCYFCVRGRISKYNHQADFGVGDHVDIERMRKYDR